MTEAIQSMLKVTNKNRDAQSDMFDGVPIYFAPKTPVNLTPDAALHIFGYPGGPITEDLRKSMYRHATRRWGLNTPQHLAERSDIKWFANFDFQPVQFTMVEVPPEETASPVSP